VLKSKPSKKAHNGGSKLGVLFIVAAVRTLNLIIHKKFWYEYMKSGDLDYLTHQASRFIARFALNGVNFASLCAML
jgi:hypothetical protein